MFGSQLAQSGTLVLLGSEGVAPSFESMWGRILDSRLRDMTILTLQSASPSLAYVSRLDLVDHIFTQREFSVQRRPFADVTLSGPAPAAFVAAETPTLLLGEEPDPPGRALAALSSLIGSGAHVIAGATAAAALGEIAVIPPARPFPRDPAELSPGVVRGFGLVAGAAVLPYFDLVPPSILEQIESQVGPDMALLGINQDAALVIGPGMAYCAGLGKVTLLRDNEVLWVGGEGETVPPELVSLTIRR